MSLWRHLSFLQTIDYISNSIEHTNFTLDTNMQQHNVHFMIKEDVTLTEDEGHRLRPNVIKIGHISQTITLKDIIAVTKVQFNRLDLMT